MRAGENEFPGLTWRARPFRPACREDGLSLNSAPGPRAPPQAGEVRGGGGEMSDRKASPLRRGIYLQPGERRASHRICHSR